MLSEKSNKNAKHCVGAVDNTVRKLLSPPLYMSKSSRGESTKGIKRPCEPCNDRTGSRGVGAGQVSGLGQGWLEGCCREGGPFGMWSGRIHRVLMTRQL